jgi:hypothetical protein
MESRRLAAKSSPLIQIRATMPLCTDRQATDSVFRCSISVSAAYSDHANRSTLL